MNLIGSANQKSEERELDEVLVPLPAGRWPDHFFARSGSNVLSFTKWDPAALGRVVAEPALELSTVPPYAALMQNLPRK